MTPGNILVVSDYLVVQVDTTGDVIDGFFIPIVNPGGIALTPKQEILITAPTETRELYRFDLEGNLLESVDVPVHPEILAVAPSGNIYISSGLTIYKMNSDLDFLDAFAVPQPPGSAPRLTGLEILPDGDLLVAAYSQNGRVGFLHRLSPEGDVLASYGETAFQIHGLAVTASNKIYYGLSADDQAGFALAGEIVQFDPANCTGPIEDTDPLNCAIDRFPVPVEINALTGIPIPSEPIPELTISRSGPDVVLSWPATSQPGVEYSPDMSPGSWIELGNFSPADGVWTFTDSDPVRTARPSGYYRAFLRPEVP